VELGLTAQTVSDCESLITSRNFADLGLSRNKLLNSIKVGLGLYEG